MSKPTLIKPPDMYQQVFTNPYFTPWYLNNLIQANNGQVNARVISHIRDMHPNLTFEEIIRNNHWIEPQLRQYDINYNLRETPFNYALNPNTMPWGAEPNDLLNLYETLDDVPNERPEEPENDLRGDDYMPPPRGAGYKRKKNKNKK